MKITHIYHISDIHFRTLKRHNEYKEVLTQFLENVKQDGIQNSVIYIAGDLVHAKTDLSPELVREVSWFLKACADLRPTFIITGNHDINLANRSRLDALTPIIDNLNHNNLYYLRDTGVYPFHNLNFVVYSILDKRENWPKAEDIDGENKICLFHGPVFTAITDTGYTITSEKFSPEIFAGFDLALLGDIHTHQEVGHENIVFAGSAIQQSHGEAVKGHGYLLWDVEARTYQFVELHNDYGFFTLDIVDGVPSDVSGMPKKPRLRVRVSNTNKVEVDKIIADIQYKYNVQEYTISRIDGNIKADNTNKDHINIYNIKDVEVQNDILEEYLIRNRDLDRKTLDKLRELNVEINDKAKSVETATNVVWKPKYFEFSNMFSYGEGNKIHFDKARGILGIFNPNATGKSAVIDALVFCLFDKTPRTFLAKHIMNNKKKWFNCQFHFEINGVDYYIKRVAKIVNKGKNVKVDVEFWKEEDGEVISLNGEHRRDTNKNINQHIGTYDDFVLTTLSLQTDNALFIDKSQTERKEKFAQFMGVDIFDKLHQVAYDDSKVNSRLIKLIEQSTDEDLSVVLNELDEQLKSERIDYETLSNDIDEVKDQKEKYNSRILELNKQLHKLKTNAQDIDTLERKQKEAQREKTTLEDDKKKLEVRLIELEEQQFIYDDQLDYLDEQKIVDNYRLLNEYNSQVNKLQNEWDKADIKRTSLNQHLEHLEGHEYNPDCDVCIKNSKSVFEQKDEVKTKLGELIDKINEIADSKNAILLKIKTLKNVEEQYNRLSELNVNANKIATEISRILDKMSNIEKREMDADIKLKDIENSICEWQENKKQIEENDQTTKQIKEVEKQYSEVEADLKQKSGELMKINNKISRLEGEKTITKEKIEELEELETKRILYEHYLFATGKDGVAYEMIEKTLPLVEGEINNILGQIVNFGIQLEMDGKNINARIVYDDQYWSLEMCSGMERFVSSLAIRIALMNICNLPHPNFLIIDEGFGALDAENLQSLLMSFAYLRTQFDFVVVISHIDHLRDSVDDTIEIQNNNGFSKVRF